MDIKVAEKLISEMRKHSHLVSLDKGLFLDLLVSTHIQDSSKFYEALPDNQQEIQETDHFHIFSLRRVLRNRNARGYRLSQWKKMYEAILSSFGIYSSDALTRNLRANANLIEMMASCEEPFSLLGKLQTFDYNNPNEVFVVTRPVLIIPGAENIEQIRDWEKANTIYEREKRFLGFPIQKRICPEEYFYQ